ncbi:inositol monophosphatase 1 [Rhinatrema bivittatum]|uniref:inositol monophosphatase 1 n=1 Tax=Rhinatrema bivittatum TaxID=194408 RepID=UPI00112E68D0|nr:inositol monophosphatase 1 [Rhinatrema bivittatum]
MHRCHQAGDWKVRGSGTSRQKERTPKSGRKQLSARSPLGVTQVKMGDPWQECMDFAIAIARKAGEVICGALKKEARIMLKSSPADLVTETDQKVEAMIISSIKEKFPSHSFIGEESVAAGDKSTLSDNPTWIIDPIDGTTNFVHRFPFVAVSIGFAVKKEIEFGVVYSCVEDKMYTGRRGKGAFCNGQKLHVSGQKDITKSLIITELGSSRDPETVKIVLSNIERLLCIPIHGIRAVGTAAVNMCLVATGGADAYYEMGIHCWDMAAAAVIITEAGGVVLDTSGGTFDLMSRRIIAASSRELGERIAKELQIIPLERD